ncbi:MAG: hypothetical protein UR28_C0035G0017 [Candidatus Peregrinibacteria bacterium GW2011_GWF2_33_10]|nr:MAG: hypothetical protein UR28_C0035G0017 [Candidatus Peregrinibacteria bacterium GW2011_GWF2_33_10]OGJ46079.1 MAG: hypothetical protein A2263_00415 [Candidatus Peregrinibacteria bacterium RIFOXYA2_FULL_33_21]OGJ46892.1 MAG: hypothetical protein A2272_06780 [Candidatus Peregrinibacteria bacterium RIFOXYA12_FULL_33_12]OGJ51756.1 MAG: hypothetical protein A2307_05850 [Candidatus Peregrinibacteria bacterium RIFOXYB2_FULL_33_20]
MDIFVTSENGHKIAAARQATTEIFNTSTNITGIKSDEGFDEQIEGMDKILDSAFMRNSNLKRIISNTRYDLILAIQEGSHTVMINGKEHTFNTAWVVAEDSDGNQAMCHSTGAEFPQEYVTKARERGFKTTTITSVMVEGTHKDPTDPYPPLTNNIVSREDVLCQTIKATIGQLLRKSPNLCNIISSGSNLLD